MPFLLIVDDDALLRETLCDLFAGEYFCQPAASAEEALAMIEKEPFDVVITDISMPGMSGLEMFGHMRQRQPDTPVIILSGIGDETYRTGVLNLGAYAYHYKPFQLAEIEASVVGAVEHRRRLVAARQRNSEDAPDQDQFNLYALSLFAAKPDSGATEHDAEVIFALSEAEAKHKGIDQANERWPRADGWIEHSVIVREIQPDIISRAAASLTRNRD